MFCMCIMCVAGLVGSVGAASHLEKFAIKDISITGVQKLSPDTLTATVSEALNKSDFWFFSRKNMFLYPRAAIASKLASQFPRIKDVSVTRASLLAQAVVVTVQERKAFATWCLPAVGATQAGSGDEKCYVMDSDGFIYAESGPPIEAGESPSSAYVFRGGLIPNIDIIGQTFLRGRIQGMVQFLGDLEKAGFKAHGIIVDSEKDFTVRLESGTDLLASFDAPPSDSIRNVQTALEAEGLREKMETLEYIDLRFGNRVYYK